MTQKELAPDSVVANQAACVSDEAVSDTTRTGQKRTVTINQRHLHPQQRYVKRPKHAGMATFDGNLQQLPLHGSRTRIVEQASLPKSMSTPRDGNTSEGSNTAGSQSEKLTSQRSQPLEIEITGGLMEDEKLRWQRAYAPEFVFAMDDLATTLSKHPSKVREFLLDSLKLNCMPIKIHDRDFSQPDNLNTIRQLDICQRDSTSLAKLIYAELAAVSAIENAATKISDSDGFCDPTTWRILAGFRSALLREFHDFFEISRNPHSPLPLQRLARKYGESGVCTKSEVKKHKLNLCRLPQRARLQILNFANRARVFLETFVLTFPDPAAEWEMINDNIHCYLHTVEHANVGASCVYQCIDVPISKRWESWRNFIASPCNVLDDELRTRHQDCSPQPPDYSYTQIDDMYTKIELPLKECMLWVLSGWLIFGPRVASSFHEYCKVTRFLAWFGATF